MMERSINWLSPDEAATIAPGLSASRLRGLQAPDSGPAAWSLSDGSVLYDELEFRGWLEGAVD